MKKTRIGKALAAAAGILILAGCRSGPEESESQMTSYTANATKSETASLFTVPADQMAHVQVVPVEKTRLERVLRLTGSVAYNGFTTTPVFTSVSGPVRQILATPGQIVHTGQALLTVNSPDYSQDRSAYMKAKDTYELANKNYQRAVDLYQHKAIAERDLQQAESDREQAQADVQSSADALRALGVANPDSLLTSAVSPIPVPAPANGEIVERLVGPGQLLQAGATQCFTISDTSTVWVLVNVYQSDIGNVKVGNTAEITTDAFPETFHGKISYIAPAMDATTRTIQARIVTRNPGDRLKKDMYVTATVLAGVIPDALTIPDAAVLHDTENQPFVYVQTGSNQFARRLVEPGNSHSGRTQILSGLKEGESVVGDGSLFLQFKNSLQQ